MSGRSCSKSRRTACDVRDVHEVGADDGVRPQAAGPSLCDAVVQLALDEVERALGLVDEHDVARLEGHDLAGQLRADGARSAGDDDRAVVEDVMRSRRVLLGQRAAQQVLDPHLADAGGVQAAVQEIRHRRYGAHREPLLAGGIDDAADGIPGGARHRDEKRRGARDPDGPAAGLAAPEDLEPGDARAGEVGDRRRGSPRG